MLICSDQTGRINHVMNDPIDKAVLRVYQEDADIQCVETHEDYDFDVLMSQFYLANNRLVSRPIMPLLRDAVSFPVGETYRFDGIPKGAWIRFDGKEGACEDGVLDLTASAPGEYSLSIEKWPFLDAEVRVNVVPAQMGANS